jgi:glycosyltransferase involved in cell wall biosynthesis
LQLTRVDKYDIPNIPSELRLFSVMRNESLRLPAFLRYYRSKGVCRFFVVDNGSTDGTTELLLSCDDVHVFHTGARYSESRSGTLWIMRLLDSYARNHWCVVADADEFIIYPHAEHLSISDVCRYLDDHSFTAVRSLLLDMYSDKSFSKTTYTQGADLLATCPYHDADVIMQVDPPPSLIGTYPRWTGGMRKRVFGINVDLAKMGLFRYLPPMRILGGMHGVTNATVADIKCAVLHFKFLYDFPVSACREANREEHWHQALEYKAYRNILSVNPQLSAFETSSQRLQTSTDLLNGGLMRSSDAFDRFYEGRHHRQATLEADPDNGG